MGINGSGTSSTYALYTNGKGIYAEGAIYATGNITAYSDRRNKTNIITVNNALDTILKLRGVFYNRIETEFENIDPNKRNIGVIAQEVKEVLPEVVEYDASLDQYGVNYGNFAGLFIEAIKEQTEIINNLKKEIEMLKSKLGEK
jgi:hypothetical protein